MGLLGGVRTEKQEDSKKDKKTKKKERRKEQKKRKKREKGKKKDKAGSSSSTSEGSAEETATTNAAPVATSSATTVPRASTPSAAQEVATDSSATKDEQEDFFAKMGTEHKKKSNKPNPDATVVHKHELNPLLQGKESSWSVPVSLDQKLDKSLTVGDGGAAWRRRAKRRADQVAAEAAGEAPPPLLRKLGGGEAPDESKTMPRRDRSKSRRRSRSRSRGRERSGGRKRSRSGGKRERRSPTPQRKRDRKSPTPQRKRGHQRCGSGSRERSKSRSRSAARGAAPRGRGSLASADWCKRDEKILQERAQQNPDDDMEAVLQKIKSKYDGTSATSAAGAVAAAVEAPTSQGGSAVEIVPEDGNELAALAMQAMLSGDMERYEELNRRLEKKQADDAKDKPAPLVSASSNTLRGANGERVEIIEEIDAAGRHRSLVESVQTASVGTGQRGAKKLRGVANVGPGSKDTKGKKEDGFYADDNISLEDLIRKERIEGVQDYDANFAAHIAKTAKYKKVHEDDDEAYALGHYEKKDNQTDAKKLAERQQKQQVQEKQRIKHNLENCWYCMESRRFKFQPQIISSSTHAYVAMDNMKDCILPGQVFIRPREHLPSTTDLDDSVYTEIRNYQKCLVRYFESQDPPRAVIFAESSITRVSREKLFMGAGPHGVVIAYPVEMPVFSQARSFFKKAFDEAECEWSTQHKKVIETTAKGGVRAAIPKNFPFVHVDFSLGGGYAHVVEDEAEFPKDFASQTIAGMCELTVLDRAYSTKEQWTDAIRTMKAEFQKEYDWTQSLH